MHVLKKELTKGQDRDRDKEKDKGGKEGTPSGEEGAAAAAASASAGTGTTPPSTGAAGNGAGSPIAQAAAGGGPSSSSSPTPQPNGSGGGAEVVSASGNPADLWWTHLASMVLQLAEEQRRLAEGVTAQVSKEGRTGGGLGWAGALGLFVCVVGNEWGGSIDLTSQPNIRVFCLLSSACSGSGARGAAAGAAGAPGQAAPGGGPPPLQGATGRSQEKQLVPR